MANELSDSLKIDGNKQLHEMNEPTLKAMFHLATDVLLALINNLQTLPRYAYKVNPYVLCDVLFCFVLFCFVACRLPCTHWINPFHTLPYLGTYFLANSLLRMLVEVIQLLKQQADTYLMLVEQRNSKKEDEPSPPSECLHTDCTTRTDHSRSMENVISEYLNNAVDAISKSCK